MSSTGPFGFDPDDLDRVAREALDGLGRFFVNERGAAWGGLVDEFSRFGRPKPETETSGEAGDGVWAIFTVDDAGGARIEQVFPTELGALRANSRNTDPARRVRFLPYGIAVGVLDTDQPEQ